MNWLVSKFSQICLGTKLDLKTIELSPESHTDVRYHLSRRANLCFSVSSDKYITVHLLTRENLKQFKSKKRFRTVITFRNILHCKKTIKVGPGSYSLVLVNSNKIITDITYEVYYKWV